MENLAPRQGKEASILIQVILVPQGAEYRAVCRGLSPVATAKPTVLPIPLGPKPLARFLAKLQQERYFQCNTQLNVLLMGLCGSLSPEHDIGDIAIYRDCIYNSPASPQLSQSCDRQLTNLIHQILGQQASWVRALTSDRPIWSATEKLELCKVHGAEVVDMEGFAALEALNPDGIAVAMVRVVSDNCDREIPDLTSVLGSDGSLQPLPLALRFLQQPIAATRLIRGSLKGLRVLQQVTTNLFQKY